MSAFDYSFDELSVALSFAVGFGSAVAPAHPAQKQGKKEAKKQAAAADDDMDLFGDDEPATETKKESMAERAARMKKEKDEKANKNKKVERSQVLFEVKPVDTEVGTS